MGVRLILYQDATSADALYTASEKINDFMTWSLARFYFKTIAVAGQTDVEADSTDDTITLVAGANVTLTTSGKNVTIACDEAGVDTTAFVLTKLAEVYTGIDDNATDSTAFVLTKLGEVYTAISDNATDSTAFTLTKLGEVYSSVATDIEVNATDSTAFALTKLAEVYTAIADNATDSTAFALTKLAEVYTAIADNATDSTAFALTKLGEVWTGINTNVTAIADNATDSTAFALTKLGEVWTGINANVTAIADNATDSTAFALTKLAEVYSTCYESGDSALFAALEVDGEATLYEVNTDTTGLILMGSGAVFTAGENINRGQGVYVSGNDEVSLAIAGDSTNVVGVAAQGIESAADGVIGFTGAIIKNALAGATAGNVYYLSDSDPGELTATRPDGAGGDAIIQVGIAKNATDLIVQILNRVSII